MTHSHSLTVWINGNFVSEREASVSIFDDGFTRGDAAFDAARTFGGRPFQLEEHVNRLLQSCEVLNLKPALSKEEFIKTAREVVERNQSLLGEYGDFWIDFRVTRGAHRVSYSSDATTIILCDPIPFKDRAHLYREGISLVIPSVRRTPHWAVSPRIKSHNYLNFVLAELEVKQTNPGSWALLLDERGNLAEGSNSNIFLVRDGELFTPKEQFVLPGITRATVIKLARETGISVHETDLDTRDLYLADEVFLTSTSLCVCGVRSTNGRPVKEGAFGPVTQKLLAAYGAFAGVDIRKQYLEFYDKLSKSDG